MVKDLASVDYVMGERRCVMSSGNPEPYAVSILLSTSHFAVSSDCPLGGGGLLPLCIPRSFPGATAVVISMLSSCETYLHTGTAT